MPHWYFTWVFSRYEDYDAENTNPQVTFSTPNKISANDCSEDDSPTFSNYGSVTEGAEEELPSPLSARLGDKKLRGIPTPNGKSIFFLTPNKPSEGEDAYQYNVHWR
jgi:hypothetical protein